MSVDAHFWWNWWVQVAVAIGTVLTVVVALFGDSIRGMFVRLAASIDKRSGVYTPTLTPRAFGTMSQSGHILQEGEARYFQLRVSNASRRFPAHRVDVWLVRVDIYGEDDGPVDAWIGELPLIWQHQDHIPGPHFVSETQRAPQA